VAEHRSGLGVDVDRAAVGRALFLGGVRFPGEPGLRGHSDGDVVCHALADELLGAAALGDVGDHFPEGDPAVAGIAGMDLLARTVVLVRGRDLSPQSADVTVIAERPAIAPAREEMRRNVAATLGIGVDRDPRATRTSCARPDRTASRAARRPPTEPPRAASPSRRPLPDLASGRRRAVLTPRSARRARCFRPGQRSAPGSRGGLP